MNHKFINNDRRGPESLSQEIMKNVGGTHPQENSPCIYLYYTFYVDIIFDF